MFIHYIFQLLFKKAGNKKSQNLFIHPLFTYTLTTTTSTTSGCSTTHAPQNSTYFVTFNCLWLVSGRLIWVFYEQVADYCQRIANVLFSAFMVNSSIYDFYYDHYQPKIRILIRNEKLIFMVNRCPFHLVTNKSHIT